MCVSGSRPGYAAKVPRRSSREPHNRFLSIYLNDHRAGAIAGTRLSRRFVRQSEPGEARDVVQAVADEIADDRRSLEQIARLMGVRANPAKLAGARVAEVVGRLKFNGRLRTRSPLSAMIELEGLLAGIDAKRSLWSSLQIADRPELVDFDFDHLAARATEQRARLVPLHRRAAGDALGKSAVG